MKDIDVNIPIVAVDADVRGRWIY